MLTRRKTDPGRPPKPWFFDVSSDFSRCYPYENHPKSMFLAMSLCLCETSEISGFDGCGACVPLSLRNCANFGENLSRNLRVGLVSCLFRPGFARRQRDRDSEPVPELVKIGRFGKNAHAACTKMLTRRETGPGRPPKPCFFDVSSNFSRCYPLRKSPKITVFSSVHRSLRN